MIEIVEQKPVATVEVIPTLDGNEINFKPTTSLWRHLIREGEAELYLSTQHHPLPEVPEYVGDEIKRLKQEYGSLRDLYSGNVVWLNNGTRYLEGAELDLAEWVIAHENTFEKAWINGYTVQKPKRFYLKDKLTGMFLYKMMTGDSKKTVALFWNIVNDEGRIGCGNYIFTQEEIDSMQTGSYEQIEAEK